MPIESSRPALHDLKHTMMCLESWPAPFWDNRFGARNVPGPCLHNQSDSSQHACSIGNSTFVLFGAVIDLRACRMPP